MGNINKKEVPVTHEVIVSTGDKKGAGASNVNVFITFTNSEGRVSSEIKITDNCKNDFHKGKSDVFHVELPSEFTKISEITVRRDETGENDMWLVERIDVKYVTKTEESAANDGLKNSVFPFNRWIKHNHIFNIVEFDSTLPQFEKHVDQRRRELEAKRDVFILTQKTVLGGPPQIEIIPEDENFSFSYLFDIGMEGIKMKIKTVIADLRNPEFSSLDEFEAMYKKGGLPVPAGMTKWKSDIEFGNQKLAGCNPLLIELCKVIPEHFPVTQDLIGSQLEGKTIEDALTQKKLYIIDLRFLVDIECSRHKKLPGPTCLLYVRDSGDLVPVAIQLMPEPADDNPIFTPSDPEYTWLAAKLWFNMAECSHHQSASHLGFTHLLMEAVAVCTHRRLSPSHPIFRLLAPHFLYVLAINDLAIKRLVQPGGWVDKAMQIGRTGMFNIIRKKWAEWNVKVNGNIVNNIKLRGVDDTEALPNYHFRDDATLLWNAIYKYVSTVVMKVYDTPEKLNDDTELKAWCKELTNEAKFNGLSSSGFTNTDELSEAVSAFIYISSVGHASVNFMQYDEYGFPPNYPSSLHTERPTNKDALTEDYIVKSLATKDEALEVMIITEILSQRGTNELGNFEVQYAHDPITLEALASFRAELKEISATIDKRNETRKQKYPYLNPKEIPNAISI